MEPRYTNRNNLSFDLCGNSVSLPLRYFKPIIDWSGLPLSKIQGVPGGNEWIASAADKDAAWAKVSAALRPALERAKQRKKKALDAMKMAR